VWRWKKASCPYLEAAVCSAHPPLVLMGLTAKRRRSRTGRAAGAASPLVRPAPAGLPKALAAAPRRARAAGPRRVRARVRRARLR